MLLINLNSLAECTRAIASSKGANKNIYNDSVESPSQHHLEADDEPGYCLGRIRVDSVKGSF